LRACHFWGTLELSGYVPFCIWVIPDWLRVGPGGVDWAFVAIGTTFFLLFWTLVVKYRHARYARESLAVLTYLVDDASTYASVATQPAFAAGGVLGY
jgi:hypothetical protein